MRKWRHPGLSFEQLGKAQAPVTSRYNNSFVLFSSVADGSRKNVACFDLSLQVQCLAALRMLLWVQGALDASSGLKDTEKY